VEWSGFAEESDWTTLGTFDRWTIREAELLPACQLRAEKSSVSDFDHIDASDRSLRSARPSIVRHRNDRVASCPLYGNTDTVIQIVAQSLCLA
jgi:hypothetical protein